MDEAVTQKGAAGTTKHDREGGTLGYNIQVKRERGTERVTERERQREGDRERKKDREGGGKDEESVCARVCVLPFTPQR